MKQIYHDDVQEEEQMGERKRGIRCLFRDRTLHERLWVSCSLSDRLYPLSAVGGRHNLGTFVRAPSSFPLLEPPSIDVPRERDLSIVD